MNKEDYSELLKRKEWINKRNSILKRDKRKCVKCNCNKFLHVHHTYYLIGKMPWEVPDDCLITLCKTCHEKEHEGKDIKSFSRKHPPKNKPKSLRKRRLKSKTQESNIKNYLFVAVKSKTLNKVFRQEENWKDTIKSVNGIVEGFDDKNLAEHWLRQGKAGKDKRKYK